MNIWTSAFGWERQCQESADLPDELDDKKKNPVQARHEHASLNTRLCNTYSVREGHNIYNIYNVVGTFVVYFAPWSQARISTLLWPWWTDTFMFLPCFSPCLLHFTLFQICFTSFHFVSLPFKSVSRHFTSFHFISNLFHFISLYFKFVSLHFTCLYSFQICFTSFRFHFISLRLTYLFFLSLHFTS